MKFPIGLLGLNITSLNYTFGFWDIDTKCWGQTLWIGIKHILPISRDSLLSRYDKETNTFWRGCAFYVNNRDILVRLQRDERWKWMRDLERQSVG
jgi:hypothetical protein